MKVRANIKIDNNVFQFESEEGKLKDALTELLEISSLFTRRPEKCGACGSDNISPIWAMTTKENYKYIKTTCYKCGAECVMGETKEGGKLFWRKEDGKFIWKVREK